ncbi:hypothetical protein BU17DRAFT_60097 [Hysterangium stoloniferum]|nr:hypothetical protein BU17DRAFT_60097 [Hysterangium stoloniferum]
MHSYGGNKATLGNEMNFMIEVVVGDRTVADRRLRTLLLSRTRRRTIMSRTESAQAGYRTLAAIYRLTPPVSLPPPKCWCAHGPNAIDEPIKPTMFNSLIGRVHEEFSMTKQQDAEEFFSYIFLKPCGNKLKTRPEAGAYCHLLLSGGTRVTVYVVQVLWADPDQVVDVFPDVHVLRLSVTSLLYMGRIFCTGTYKTWSAVVILPPSLALFIHVTLSQINGYTSRAFHCFFCTVYKHLGSLDYCVGGVGGVGGIGVGGIAAVKEKEKEKGVHSMPTVRYCACHGQRWSPFLEEPSHPQPPTYTIPILSHPALLGPWESATTPQNALKYAFN